MTKTYRPPTPIQDFERVTPLMLEFMTYIILNKKKHFLTEEQSYWFIAHVDLWVRWFHANNSRWRRRLENDGRDWMCMWIEHWRDAYLHDPEHYRNNHPHYLLGG